MTKLSILLTFWCLYLALPALARDPSGSQKSELQRVEIRIADHFSNLIGLEFLVNSHSVIQIHINPMQTELFTPQHFSSVSNKDLENLILKTWQHKLFDGIHILTFDLPPNVYRINILGKLTADRAKGRQGTRIGSNGEIRNASIDGSYIISVSQKRIAVLPGGSITPKKMFGIKLAEPECVTAIENITEPKNVQ